MASVGTRRTRRGGITSLSIKQEGVRGDRIHPDVLSGEYLRYQGAGQPRLFLADNTGFASGADAVEHVALLPNGLPLHYTPIAAAAVLGPIADAAGLFLNLDLTDDDGVNYVPGGLLGAWRTVVERTAGLNPPDGVFIRLRGVLQDVSGTDDFAVGFRKAEAPQAAIDDYDELAAVNVISGNVFRESILNNAATVSVDSGYDWADGEEHEFLAVLYGNGKVKLYFDGREIQTAPEYQFDDAEVVVPFIYFIEAADLTTFNLTDFEVGRLSQIGKK
jgi:hypothetical protein